MLNIFAKNNNLRAENNRASLDNEVKCMYVSNEEQKNKNEKYKTVVL